MSRDAEPTAFDHVTLVRETDAAYIFDVYEQEVTIPKQFILDGSEIFEGEEMSTLVIPEWLAIDRELV